MGSSPSPRNVPAANVPAANVPAANVPAANIPAANVPAANIPAEAADGYWEDPGETVHPRRGASPAQPKTQPKTQAKAKHQPLPETGSQADTIAALLALAQLPYGEELEGLEELSAILGYQGAGASQGGASLLSSSSIAPDSLPPDSLLPDSLPPEILQELQVQDDVIPEGAIVSIGMLPWEMYAFLRQSPQLLHYPGASPNFPQQGDGLPIVLVQTSQPKARSLIQLVNRREGIAGIVFNPGHDQESNRPLDIGLMQLGDSSLHTFGEYDRADPVHRRAMERWQQRIQATENVCGLLIAKGVTGKTKGQPGIHDMMALMETQAITPQNIGLGTLRLQSLFRWPFA